MSPQEKFLILIMLTILAALAAASLWEWVQDRRWRHHAKNVLSRSHVHPIEPPTDWQREGWL